MPGSLLPAFAAAIAALNMSGFERVSGTQGIDRAIMASVMSCCESLEGSEADSLNGLLRRLDAEAAREEARLMADSFADDAALALLVEADPSLLVELDEADLRNAA
jgi:hypothetical protein